MPEVLPLLAEAEKTAPQLVDLYVVRGAVYTGLRQRDIAIRDLKRALEMSPNTTQAASMLGYYYLTGGEPREALTYYSMASALDLRDFGWHAYRCMALTDLAHFDEAEKACDLARSLGPSSPWVYSTSSSLEAARGRLDEAIRYSQLALERDDDIAEIHAARGRWLMRLGLMKDAGDAVRQAIAASPEGARRNVPLLMVGAAAATDVGGAAALKAFVKEFGLDESNDASLLFELANAYLAAHQFAPARACVDRALASADLTAEDLASPWKARTGTSYLLISAVAMRATGEGADAQRRLEQLEALLARTTDAGVRTSGLFELKAQLAAQQGRADVAMAALEQATRLGWNSVWQAEHEPYFDSLRGRQDFQALLAAARARNASAAAKLGSRLLPSGKKGDSGRPSGRETL